MELMIATMVFSVLLVVLTVGVLSFTRGFYKGLNSSATQTTARNLMNAIATGAEYAHIGDINDTAYNGPVGCLKIGSVEYHFYLGQLVDGSGLSNPSGPNYGVYRTTNGAISCDPSNLTTYNASLQSDLTTSPQPGSELLGTNMRVTELGVKQDGDGLANVSVGVAYGSDDLLCSSSLDASDPTVAGGCNSAAPVLDNSPGSKWFIDNGSGVQCKSTTGDQFCAVTHLTTSVQPRLMGIGQ